MALMLGRFKNGLAALLLACTVANPASAATFQAKRGINLDIWTTWPNEDRWGDPAVILPYPEWRHTLGEAELRALKADGFDFVRMPVDPAPLLAETAAPLREALFASVLDSVRLANRAGLKVVVDMHTIPWGEGREFSTGKALADDALFDRYVDTVRDMAKTLSQEDSATVALELMNEPTLECDGSETTWPERLKRLFAAARASATRLTLVLPGACWSSDEGLAKLDPKGFPDDNLMWTFHSYKPFLLTHQGATWAGDFIPYVTGLPYPPDSMSKAEIDGILEAIREKIRAEAPLTRRAGLLAYLDEQFAETDTTDKVKAVMEAPFLTVDAWAKVHGVKPQDILLGEFGMIRQEYGNPNVMKPEWRAAYVRDMIGLAEKHGYAWSIWDYGGAFGVVDEFDGRKAEGDVLEVIRGLPK